MKLKDYAKLINELAKDHGDKDVYYSTDDEGNDFNLVHFSPSVSDAAINGKLVIIIN